MLILLYLSPTTMVRRAIGLVRHLASLVQHNRSIGGCSYIVSSTNQSTNGTSMNQ